MKRGILLVALILAISSFAADDLKSYYEKQKAEILPTFSAPQLGSQVTIKITNGQTRTGILMKLSADSLSLMSDTGATMDYKRTALHETSRAQFFAGDFAHIKALELTKEYKDKLHAGYVAEKEAGVHDGRITVTAKSEKENDKEVEKEERENKNTGEKRVYTTTTRTYQDVINLKVNVANFATHADSFTVKYCFFGQRVSKGERNNNKKNKDTDEIKPGTLSLKSEGVKKVSVDPRGRKTVDIKSEPFVITKTELDTGTGYTNRDPAVKGEESAGWLVILMYGDRVLDTQASHKSYLSESWIKKYK